MTGDPRGFWLRSVLAVAIASAFGAAISRRVFLGGLPWYLTPVLGCPAGLVWGWMAMASPRYGVSLTYATVVFDVITTLTGAAIFALFGERITPTQWIGIGVALAGTAIVGAK